MSAVTDHVFYADPWWGRCAGCGYAESAHHATYTAGEGDAALASLPYRCPYCVDRQIDPCSHGREGGLDPQLQPLHREG